MEVTFAEVAVKVGSKKSSETRLAEEVPVYITSYLIKAPFGIKGGVQVTNMAVDVLFTVVTFSGEEGTIGK